MAVACHHNTELHYQKVEVSGQHTIPLKISVCNVILCVLSSYHYFSSTLPQSLCIGRNLKPQQILFTHFRNYTMNPQKPTHVLTWSVQPNCHINNRMLFNILTLILVKPPKTTETSLKGYILKELYLNTGLKIQRSRYLILIIRHSKFYLFQFPFSLGKCHWMREKRHPKWHTVQLQPLSLTVTAVSNTKQGFSHPGHQVCLSIYDDSFILSLFYRIFHIKANFHKWSKYQGFGLLFTQFRDK